MTYYQLAINEDGEPFGVGPEVEGWRPKRVSDGRGRPALVHARNTGKPLILPVDASHADLFAQAGPGRYRCEAVDAEGHRIEGVPVACTGPLTGDGTSGDDELREELPTAKSHLEVVINQMGQMANANTRMAEKAVEQMGIVMSGVAQLGAVVTSIAELIRATHSAEIRPMPPLPVPPPPIVIEVDDRDDDEPDEDENDEEEVSDDASNAPGPETAAPMPEVVRFIIKETIAKVVPMIFERIGASGAVAGIPLEALLDWRKAAPNVTPIDVPSTPTASVAPPSVAVPSSPPRTPPSVAGPSPPPNVAVPSSPPTSPSSPIPDASPGATATPTSSSTAQGGDPPGALSAGMATAPVQAGSSPESEEDAAALLDAHVTRIWQGLSPLERTRAGDLIARLNPEGRAALLAELVRLSVPEAVARARALLETIPPV